MTLRLVTKSNAVKFPGHRRQRCPEDCGDCNICALYLCATCGGAEASLPTHCPGARMDRLVEECVQDGSLDYRDGEWRFMCWDEGPTHTGRTRS